jgi:hypothetical protein
VIVLKNLRELGFIRENWWKLGEGLGEVDMKLTYRKDELLSIIEITLLLSDSTIWKGRGTIIDGLTMVH